MNKTGIDWCTHTWNPVIGCRRGCPYCWARALHEMRRKAKLEGKNLPDQYILPFEQIQYIPDRLQDPGLKARKPRTVFVGSTTDIEYWDHNYMNDVLAICGQHPQHTFMFLTKNPTSYGWFKWPANTMQGLTMDLERVASVERNLEFLYNYPRPYLSIEPIMGPLGIKIKNKIELVIVGAMTKRGNNNIEPRPRWIQNIKDNCPADKICWKNNIKKYL